MKNWILSLSAFMTMVSAVHAATVTMTTPNTNTTQGACSYDPVTIKLNNPLSGTTQSTFNLSTVENNPGVTFYSDVYCTQAITQIKVLQSQNFEKNFYVKNISTGAFTLKALRISGTLQGTKSMSTMTAYNVLDYGANGSDESVDSTTAFKNAMTAATNGTKDYAGGVNGSNQAIIYVPAGTYRIKSVNFKSNVRMEVDARAVIKGPPAVTPMATCNVYLSFDAPNSVSASVVAPITNVSLIGVGTDSSKAPGRRGQDLTHSFTINHDPVQNGCDGSGTTPILVRNVDGFLIKNIYSIQNNQDPSDPVTYSGASVITFRSGMAGVTGAASPFNGPRNGTYENHYNIGSPAGYGPNQIQSVIGLDVANIYSEGGVALRMETDYAGNQTTSCPGGVNPCFAQGAKVDGVVATNIECYHGNSAIYLAAHHQQNGSVSVDDIKSDGCYSGIVQSASVADTLLKTGEYAPTLTNAVLVGDVDTAQKPNASQDTWTPGEDSLLDLLINDGAESWSVIPNPCTSSGTFFQTPVCQ